MLQYIKQKKNCKLEFRLKRIFGCYRINKTIVKNLLKTKNNHGLA
jgi:hypothetical protein